MLIPLFCASLEFLVIIFYAVFNICLIKCELYVEFFVTCTEYWFSVLTAASHNPTKQQQ